MQDVISTSGTNKNGFTGTALFNPFLPEFRSDPYPFYHRLRSKDPIHWSYLGFWVITRYADNLTLLRDSRFSSDLRNWSGYEQRYIRREHVEFSPLAQLVSKWITNQDPPYHTRLRGLVSKAFNPRSIEAMRPHIQDIVNQLLDRVQDAGVMDVIADLAYPLPITVIAQMLGVPVEDRDRLKQWSFDISRTLDPVMTLDLFKQVNSSIMTFIEYLRHLITERRNHPQQDLLSAMIVAREQSDMLSEDELIATCIFLFAAGHETTSNLIGNGLLALLRHPDELDKLKQNPTLIQSAIEELLRYESPVQLWWRTALEDIEFGNSIIRKGQMVIVHLGAANRDPDQFPDPDRLDITRRENRHIAFSNGIHTCLGAALARLEAEIVFNTLLERMPNLKLQSNAVEWHETMSLRSLKALPIAFN
ncbi:cytochrome P450 [Nostoc sp. 'Lobaria pulmonaria (5183) cyanobiont']|uniref:cytochrome P450 n=1 Tax=Nostoc sp. 'Lobaria pulmonaria (5183) cyanobiont' TaxID=1618022 RepID=UPI000CF30304|nr:cytochrome P450 [Nostoc sp. 'Lobaria pulmonaria (5183) cyanobiont']AVH74387.1 cytochrome P450 [Nostoc sp. 'Lobaria pulmonaria (5183) cyanobiont']